MSQTIIGLIGLGILTVLLLIGMDIGYTMLITGFIGFSLIGGLGPGLSNTAIVTFNAMWDYNFSALPLFLLMGTFVSEGKLGKQAYEMVRAWMGQFKGGLAMATVGASAVFGAISGSSLAGSLVMGKVAYPEMRRIGYKMKLAAGVVSVGGTLGILIPPSMAFIIIGILANLSIGKLFIAGIIPGILVTLFYMGTVYIWCKIDPKLAPAQITKPSLKEKFATLKLTWPVVALFFLVMGGIYTGLFTAVEAGAVGAFGALIIAVAMRQLNGKEFWKSLMDCAKMVAMIIILIVGAYTLNNFLAVTQIPNDFGNWIVGLGIGKWGIMVLIIIFYVVAGTFFDPYSILILTIPIFYPAVKVMGFDLIWYSVIMVRLIEIGNISPPAGINLFGLKGVIDAPMSEIFRGVIPFLFADALNIALLCLVPAIATFLPNLM
jgi:tripartite ATP-independent transporter DctM subunit